MSYTLKFGDADEMKVKINKIMILKLIKSLLLFIECNALSMRICGLMLLVVAS